MFVLSKEGTINNIVSIIEFNHQIKSMRYVCIFVGKLQVYTVLCTHYLYVCSMQCLASVYLARVARHAAVEAGEGAGWAAQPRGEDAAHGAGQRQPRADVACTHKNIL